MGRRIHLSPPLVGEEEEQAVVAALRSGWVAPAGPEIDALEREFADRVGARCAVAVASGTAALHLALRVLGLKPGEGVVCSTLTFVASAAPVVQERGELHFVDSEERSWNMDPERLAALFQRLAKAGGLPRAVILVHLYGQSADVGAIAGLCRAHGVELIEDAAEALGATYRGPGCQSGRAPGAYGRLGFFSLNGNKIVTASGGGVLVTDDPALAERARFFATQARDPAPHYQHSRTGYNYRMSNVLAALGRVQLRRLDQRVDRRIEVYQRYTALLEDVPGLSFMPEAGWGRSTRWLTCVVVDRAMIPGGPERLRLALAAEDIEARPVWKPLHLQPAFAGCTCEGGEVAARLFAQGLCLPSGPELTMSDQERICRVIRGAAGV